ncbi:MULTISPECIES: TadE/TadG family type IV pilus assembly protein [unclassified Luteococcus]|uniref:TadE/TadG family type IV pilus assembly protein n=1 Tax=unclassified Luteococcus TaxID=2639923 RepID=UPI00313AD570
MTGGWRGRLGGATGGSERGAVAVEVVLIVPLLMLVLGTIVAGWRLWSARTQVTDAASSAARAATVERSGSVARGRAEAVARANLDSLDLPCRGAAVEVDVADFARPPGERGEVRVDIACTVSLADLLTPGLPGQWEVRGEGRHTMDTFRERQP